MIMFNSMFNVIPLVKSGTLNVLEALKGYLCCYYMQKP